MNIFNFKAISTKPLFTNKKIAVVSVINDLVTDVRVKKTCLTLLECNYEVVLIGRKLTNSKPLNNLPFKAIRMTLLFKQGPFFYLFFNFRLFFKLLFQKADLLYANDLDTLLANYFISKIKRVPLIYDSHELFCEVPELEHSPFKKRIWQWLEAFIVPKLKYNITVSDSIADWFNEKYKIKFEVIRNIPPATHSVQIKSRKMLKMPEDKKIILLQGAGINIDRGAEELVEAMKYVNDTVLYIIGSGDVWHLLKEKVKALKLDNKIVMIDKLPKEELLHYTCNADLGLTIDKNTNLNYYYSLPNKLFDYIQAGIPLLASRLKEIEKIVNQYQIGEFIENHEVAHIADRINQLLNSDNLLTYKQNTQKAVKELSWDVEKEKLILIIKSLNNF